MSRKKRRTVRKGTIIGLLVILALVSVYSIRSTYYSSHFLPNTTVNQIDVSNLTVDAANKKLQEDYKNQPLTITEDGKTWKELSKTDLGYKTDFSSELQSLKDDQSAWSWGAAYVSADEKETIDPVDVDHDKLDATVATVTSELTQLNEGRTETKDATISTTSDGFTITPEVKGTSIDVDKAIAQLKKDASSGADTLELSKFQTEPDVLSTDKDLAEQVTEMNTIANVKATYSINGETFQIPTTDITSWLTYTDGKIDLDDTKVTAYVTALGEKYNTSTNNTKFESTKRGEVSIEPGSYTWTIQTADEVAALKKQILAGEDFSRSPIVQGSTTADHPLIEDTYIEVDLENQHMWYYKDGKSVIDTDIVSGKPSTETPTGVYYVWNKEEDATLKGEDYATPVDYWMPIDWTGVGIHDSDWQPAYGGDLWETNGSHGCINTPPDIMKELYAAVEVGTPVLVF